MPRILMGNKYYDQDPHVSKYYSPNPHAHKHYDPISNVS